MKKTKHFFLFTFFCCLAVISAQGGAEFDRRLNFAHPWVEFCRRARLRPRGQKICLEGEFVGARRENAGQRSGRQNQKIMPI